MTIYARALETANRLIDKYGAEITITRASGATTRVMAVQTSLNFDDMPQTLHGQAQTEFVVQALGGVEVGDVLEFAGRQYRAVLVRDISPAGTLVVQRVVVTS